VQGKRFFLAFAEVISMKRGVDFGRYLHVLVLKKKYLETLYQF
jgi:hypothetical protein